MCTYLKVLDGILPVSSLRAGADECAIGEDVRPQPAVLGHLPEHPFGSLLLLGVSASRNYVVVRDNVGLHGRILIFQRIAVVSPRAIAVEVVHRCSSRSRARACAHLPQERNRLFPLGVLRVSRQLHVQLIQLI